MVPNPLLYLLGSELRLKRRLNLSYFLVGAAKKTLRARKTIIFTNVVSVLNVFYRRTFTLLELYFSKMSETFVHNLSEVRQKVSDNYFYARNFLQVM